MASNRFANYLHRNTNKMTVILVYTLLEWILIVLLLINGLFCSLISKFASFFGLKSPCLFCSRIDSATTVGLEFYRSLLCETHASDIARLGYCSAHDRFVESKEVCIACSLDEEAKRRGLCSCCDARLDDDETEGFRSPCFDLKTDLVSDGVGEVRLGDEIVNPHGFGGSDQDRLVCLELIDSTTLSDPDRSKCEVELENEGFCVVGLLDLDRLIPVELIDCTTLTSANAAGFDDKLVDESVCKTENCFGLQCENLSSSIEVALMDLIVSEPIKNENVKCDDDDEIGAAAEGFDIVFETILGDVKLNEGALVSEAESNNVTVRDLCIYESSSQSLLLGSLPSSKGNVELTEEISQPLHQESNCIIEKDLCNHESISQSMLPESFPSSTSTTENSTPLDETMANKNSECEQPKEATSESEPLSKVGGETHPHLFVNPEHNESEEQRAPETPSYVEDMSALHRRLFFDHKESGTESLDGSVVSDIDGNEGLTIDRLKSALKAERKAMAALYAELDEERSASAIAANQTMAMITRLQEEKAAMQMEALQYQRMMEEQSEYDQEALQLLNELMTKREKEKQELEKELDVCRKKVLLYEAKEKRMAKKAAASSAVSSASSSATDDIEELSVELNEGDDKFCNGTEESCYNTHMDLVLKSETVQEDGKHLSTLHESLDEFEEERLSILEQLKSLEEKLFLLDDDDGEEEEEESHFEDVRSSEHFSEEADGNKENIVNGSVEINGIHYDQNRRAGLKGKRLLPLFDAIASENGDKVLHGEEEGKAAAAFGSQNLKYETEQNRLIIVEEVDYVYERLQALEADREFLKHCISSLKKGDKGMNLLQEILQHLRDLRNVEFRVRNGGDEVIRLDGTLLD
ncbi:hypothetical protein QJS04_geneDACA021227 [Acorus gramineus]|uniref:GTD-binding domain-containing protein n=1 Tax=Acorus gramineus TaxID=55184 RepID=A0AAV9AJJ6_ACOGR|nr:hypothetical protein QJS04_geneDACA021227 [Acorus gramineus]